MRRAIVNSLGVSERSDRSEVGTQARETLSHRGSASRMGIVRGPLAMTRECLLRAHSRNQLAAGRSGTVTKGSPKTVKAAHTEAGALRSIAASLAARSASARREQRRRETLHAFAIHHHATRGAAGR